MNPTIQEYYDLLTKHDWYYPYSDDGRVYDKGKRAESDLLKIAEGKPDYRQLFDAFMAYQYSGEPWKTPRTPKPVRPL